MANLTAIILDHEARLTPRERKRKAHAEHGFLAAVEALACNLAGLVLDPLARPLAVPKASAKMWAVAKRSANPVYGEHFRQILKLMEHPDAGLIQTVKRGYSYPGSVGRMTEIIPTAAFSRIVSPSLISWEALRRLPDPEVLVLRGTKGPNGERAEEIDYPDTRVTGRLRRQVQDINEHLAAAPIFVVPVAEGADLLDDFAQPFDPNRRTVKRIFNEGRWDANGRLYGAFWINMPKAERFRRIRLGSAACPAGEGVASCDYRQFNVRAAYHIAGHPLPDGDLYDVEGNGANRAGYKGLTNTMLNARSRLTNLPLDVQPAFPRGVKIRGLVEAIERHHAPIADLFWSGVGFRLAFMESTIVIDALGVLHIMGICALPVHDAILCPLSEAERVCDVMEQVAEQHGGFAGRPHIEVGSNT